MKKRKKLGRKLLGFMLTLAMVVGLMPGMSLTAFAETENVTGISLNKTTLSTILDTNSSGNILTATVTPSNAADKTVVWTCSDSTVVEARPNSNLGDGGYQNLCYLRTLKAGTATITVTATNGTDDTSDDQSATCTVTVYDPYPIGTVWKLGDTINLHGAWYRDPLGTAVYVYHSKDAEGKVPTDLKLIGSSVAEWRDVIPVSEYLDESKTDGYPIIPYTEDRKGSLRLSIPEDKKEETPLGIKLASGKGTASNPYVFELAYKAAPTVTAPTAKNLTYTGSAQALVTAGEATGGKMYYALGENSTTAPANNLYTTSIPTGTNVGTYYVWYKAVGDASHSDSEPGVVKVEIAKDDAAVDAVKKKIDALPASDKVTVNDKKAIEDARAAYDKLTDEQKKQIPAETVKKLEDVEKALAAAEAADKAAKASSKPMTKMTAIGKTKLAIGWIKVKGAAGYDIFFAKCNSKGKKVVCKKVKNIKGNKTFRWTKSGLKNGTSYKAYVKAYVKKDGKKKYVSKSPMMHAYTGNGTKRYTNAKSVKVNKTKVTLKKGKTFKIKAKVTKVKKSKKLMPKKHIARVRYLSTNKKVATVSKSGKIKAAGKGTCEVYAYAHNGVSRSIKVTVK